MSTRSSIYYREETAKRAGLHLYYELIEEESPVCLEVTRGPFCLTMEIPLKLCAALRNIKAAPEERKDRE